MGKQLKREITFYALCGSCGKQFIKSIINISDAEDIYEANRWIKENYKTSFTVDGLARNSNLSTSHFHWKFKSAVGMGPLQCQKRLRLTEARRLMLDENMSVTDVALEVGYESLSHFIRDYKKMFYAPPKEDILVLKDKLQKAQSK
ncbi:MAG: AraC family transcriptional regulator [Oscillospiraceae bacterium]|nr:AraC family transcriptional regulator [Oscillospiraceae bacterium]